GFACAAISIAVEIAERADDRGIDLRDSGGGGAYRAEDKCRYRDRCVEWPGLHDRLLLRDTHASRTAPATLIDLTVPARVSPRARGWPRRFCDTARLSMNR